jgi:hypothetical protein
MQKKRLILAIFSLTLLSVLTAGCSGGGDKDEMAPLSDAELLKRGAAGREAGQGGAKPPAGIPGSPDQVGGQGGRGAPPATTGN